MSHALYMSMYAVQEWPTFDPLLLTHCSYLDALGCNPSWILHKKNPEYAMNCTGVADKGSVCTKRAGGTAPDL